MPHGSSHIRMNRPLTVGLREAPRVRMFLFACLMDCTTPTLVSAWIPMKRVVITDYLEPPAAIESEVLHGVATVDCLLAKHTEALYGKLGEVDDIILCHEVGMTSSGGSA